MDAKITLSFNKEVIEKAKKYAQSHDMSLSRMMELILGKLTSKQYISLEELAISDWVSMVAEGKTEYIKQPKSSSDLKAQYHSRKKNK